MPPSFFKDAHTGISTKFMPRFSLNLGLVEQPNSDPEVSSTAVNEDSSELLNSPQSNSTAPSTGTSSKFFLAADRTNTSGKLFLLNRSSAANTHAELPEKKGNNEKNTKQFDYEDDDLQITEVRAVEHEGVEPIQNQETSNEPINSMIADESSSDLLMEALTKSQKVAAHLKNKLEESIAKTKAQEEELHQLRRMKESMRNNFKQFKENLSLLEIKSTELKEHRNKDSRMINELRAEYKGVRDTIEYFANETSVLKKKIDQLQQLRASTKFEIEKRNKEIGFLQKKLDDTSGFLSEQKIKTSTLEKTLETSRKDYDCRITEIFNSSENSNRDLLSKVQDFQSSIDLSLKPYFKETVSSLSTEIRNLFQTKVDNLSEKFSSILSIQEGSISGKIESVSTISLASTSKLSLIEQNLNFVSDSFKRNEIELKSLFQEVTDLLKVSFDEMRKDDSELLEISKLFSNIESKIEKLDKAIKHKESENSKIGVLEKSYKVLDGNCVALKKDNAILEGTVESLKNQIELTNSLEVKHKEATLENEKEITKLKNMLSTKESFIKTMDLKIQQCKVNCDSKIKTQAEIFKMVSEELETLKRNQEVETEKSNNKIKSQSVTIDELREELDKKACECKSLQSINVQLTVDVKNLTESNGKIQQRLKEAQISSSNVSPPITSNKNNNVQYKVKDIPHNDDDSYRSQANLGESDAEYVPLMRKVPKRKEIIKSIPKANVPSSLCASQTKPRNSSKSKSGYAMGKRKTLLDDDDLNTSLFDDFDFEAVGSEIMAKRYTKKKKLGK